MTIRYLIRKNRAEYAAIEEGRENTLWVHDDKRCFKPDEKIHFVEMINGKRTHKGCWANIERVYEGRLIKYRVVKHDEFTKDKKSETKRKGR